MSRGFLRLPLVLVDLVSLLVGCGHAVPAVTPVTRPAEPEYKKVSSLLDFETDSDALFVLTEPSQARLDSSHARSGHSALLLPKGTRRFAVKLSSLVTGRDFPGTWTFAGLHFYAADATDMGIGLSFNGRLQTPRTASLSPGRWTQVMVDLSPLRQSPAPTEFLLGLEFAHPLASDVWCDDVILADNHKALVSPAEGLGDGGWSVGRDGFNWVVDRPMRFRLTLPTDDVVGGWRVEESNRVRAILRAAGDAKTLTIYHDGRSYWDSVYKPLSAVEASPAYEPEHLRPAAIRIPEELGRIDRNTPGDSNHDGYNESTGSYQIVAAGRHVELTLSPRTDVLYRPVFEVKNFPPGDVRATAEGVLASDILRLADGRVLITLPVPIQRPVTLDVRVR